MPNESSILKQFLISTLKNANLLTFKAILCFFDLLEPSFASYSFGNILNVAQKLYCIALPDLFLDDICESHWSRKFDYVVLVLHFQMVQLMHHLLLRLLYCIDRCQSRSHWYQMIRNQPTWNVFHQKNPKKF